jgi:hypothetical protein
MLASDFAPDPMIMGLIACGLVITLVIAAALVALLVRWTQRRWLWWTTPLMVLTMIFYAFLPMIDGNIALLVIGGGLLATFVGCIFSRWPLVAGVIGAISWMPGFPLASRSYHPINRALLPLIAAFCAAWAMLAVAVVRARRRTGANETA